MKRICAAGCTGLMLAGCVTAPEKPDSPRRPVEGMSVSGETLFHRYCSSCHGTDATGKGPIARLLKHPPPDLRTFTRRRNGQFSSVELARFIDGRQEVPAHGPSRSGENSLSASRWSQPSANRWSAGTCLSSSCISSQSSRTRAPYVRDGSRPPRRVLPLSTGTARRLV